MSEQSAVRRYQDVVDAAVARVGSDAASLQLVDDQRPGELRLIASRGFDPESAAFWEYVETGSATTCGVALAQGERVIVPDLEEFEDFAGSDDLREYRRSGLRAVQSTPLRGRDGSVVGMLSTHWRAPHAPREEELRVIDQSVQIARATREASLHADLYRRLLESTRHARGVSAVGAAAAETRRARLLQAFVRQSRDGVMLRRCAWCGCIELDGLWVAPETFLERGLPERLREQSTHGICPGCLARELDASTKYRRA